MFVTVIEKLTQKGDKGYRTKHTQTLLKPNHTKKNNNWTYKHIQTTYNTTNNTISDATKRFITKDRETALAEKNN